jgi:alpha-tubulin suppressor-like RCC1 family protein
MGDGTVYAWGYAASSFQLGDGSGVDRATPGPVSNLTDVDAISAGDSFSLAKKRDGTLWAWGHNDTGYLGDGTFIARSTPVKVAISGVDRISAGQGHDGHALVRKSDGSLWTWGNNDSGQLGDGTPLTRSTPTRVPGLTGITAIAAGDYHTLALAADGTVWAWGLNQAGQLGDDTPFGRSTPAPVPASPG